MAARTLAMTVASAPAARLWLSHGVESYSGSSLSCKDFGGVRQSIGGVAGLSTSGVVARRDVVVCAGKRNAGPSGNGRRPRSGMQARRKQKSRIVDEDDDDAAAEKALEALFAQLEMDLNSEGEDGVDDDDAEFTDEELAQMTKELEAAFSDMDLEGLEGKQLEGEEDAGLVDMVMTDGVYSQGSGVAKGSVLKSRQQEDDDDDDDDDDEEDDFEEEDDEDDEPKMVPLEKWQLRKLIAAVEQGRRNVNVKSLSAELGMDRSDVLSFLRDPPPELLLLSAQLNNEDDEAALASEKIIEAKAENALRTATSRKQSVPPPTPSGGPQNPRNWHGNKRLKKEHVATFERVYRQTNRPSNTMIENLVNLTHVPRKKVLQWFDDRRAENQPKKKSFEDASEN